jgi:hypothetical protein
MSDTTYFLSIDDNWENVSNWSTGLLPGHCHDVFILEDSPTNFLTLDTSTQINSLHLGEGITLNIEQEAELYIYQKKEALQAAVIENVIINNGLIKVKNKFINTQLNLIKPYSILNKETGILLIDK